jgi:flagellar P-ring protein precursor FlgI
MRFLPTFFSLCAVLLAQEPPQPTPTPAPVPTQGPEPVTVEPVTQNSIGETVLSPRIRSITRLHNSMPHQLVGIGLVTGLDKTGSSDRGTRQAMLNVVRSLGLNHAIQDVIGGTTSLVTLTCTLPPFAREGQMLDVHCEVMTDASSLRNGTLLRAELKGVDGKTYVVAQGQITVGGFVAAGTNADVKKNTSSTGWVNNGGQVIQAEPSSFYSESGMLELQLLNPSPFNAASVAAGIKATLDGTAALVRAVDSGLVRIELPEDERTPENAIRILNLVGNTRVAVENPAKVIVDQASGVVLAGEGVLISPCVVGLSELTIAIVNDEEVSQPNPFGNGTTERVGRSRIEVQDKNSELKKLGGGATVSDLLQNLRTLGLQPSQLVLVFQALDQGGFLHATLEVR